MDEKEFLAEVNKSFVENAKTMQDAIMKEVDEKIASSKSKEVEEKPISKEVAQANKFEKIGKFMRATAMEDRETLKEMGIQKGVMNEGTDVDGGYLAPIEFVQELIYRLDLYGLARTLGVVWTMKAKQETRPKLAGNVTVSWVGEKSAIGNSALSFGKVDLVAKKLAGITVLTNELDQDNDPATIGLILENYAVAIAGEEDRVAFVGAVASSDPFDGIMSNALSTLSYTLPSTKITFTSVTADDYRYAIAVLPRKFAVNGKFAMDRTNWAAAQLLKDTGGALICTTANPVISNDGMQINSATAKAGYIWNYPVFITDVMPSTSTGSQAGKKFAIFGDFRGLYIGDRKAITYSMTDTGIVGSDNLYEKDLRAVRVIERVGIVVAQPEAFVCLKTSAS